MAGKKDVLLNFILNDRQARQGLKNIGDEAGKAETRFSKLSGGAKAVVGGFAALAGTAVIGFLKGAAEAALADEAAQKQLALALRNTVGATEADIAATEEWIDKTARATGVADDQLRPALADLVRTHGSLEDAQMAMGVAMDVATAKGIDLETVTKAMGKAALGNVGALGRLGIATTDASGAALDYEEALNEMARTMGGAVEEAAKTNEGQVRRTAVAWEELKEQFGAGVIQGLVEVAQTWGLAEEAMESAAVAQAALSAEMDRARHPTEKLVLTTEGLAAANEEVADAIKAVADEQRAAADPAFAVLKTSGELRKAQQEYNDSLAANGAVSQITIDAAIRLAQVQSDANVAAETFSKVGGAAAITAFENMARQAGISESQIRAMIAAMKDANKVKAPRWFPSPGRGDQGRVSQPHHTGGVVHGRSGEEVPAILRAGETVLPVGSSAAHNGNGQAAVAVYGNVYGFNDFEAKVTEAIQRARRKGRNV